MRSSTPRRRRPIWALVVDTVRIHRASMLAWAIGGAAVMVLETLAIAAEGDRTPGGLPAFAPKMLPSIEAMKPFRWPAERLDTLGGYVTYHNVTLYALLLAVYAAVLGARAIRGAEERNVLEGLLATGRSRAELLVGRALGGVAILATITVGVGVPFGLAMQIGGEPDMGGALITVTGSALAAFAAYGLAVLVSQFVRSARVASGLTSLVLVVLYVLDNVSGDIGAAGVVRYAAPFFYANRFRALVPGYGFDVAGALVLLGAGTAALSLAVVAFGRRDYQQPVWARPRPEAKSATATHAAREPRLGVRSLRGALVARGRYGLLTWGGSMAVFSGLIVFLWPGIERVWEDFEVFIPTILGAGRTPQAIYLSFSTALVSAIVAAYAVTQSSHWVADLAEGRVEAILSAPVSTARLVLERLAALLAGVAVVTLAGMAGIAIAASMVDVALDAAGLARTFVLALALGLALGGVAAFLVAALRSTLAVVTMGVVLGAMYVTDYVAPLFDWPDWTHAWSVFSAFGEPYLDWPGAADLAVLAALAIGGAALAVLVGSRRPKVS